MKDWAFQEWSLEWSMWGLGVQRTNGRGWSMDEAVICIGPLRLSFLSDRQIRESEDVVRKALSSHRAG